MEKVFSTNGNLEIKINPGTTIKLKNPNWKQKDGYATYWIDVTVSLETIAFLKEGAVIIGEEIEHITK